MPSAPYAREGRNNVPLRRTVGEMRRHAEGRGARDFAMFRTGSGRPSNAFCWFTDRHGCKVARYHETDIVTVTPEGDVLISFEGWHTISTRERCNAAFEEFGLPLACHAVGKAGATGFRLGNPRSPHSNVIGKQPRWLLVGDVGGDNVVLRITATEMGGG
jgi:hypothetical protein